MTEANPKRILLLVTNLTQDGGAEIQVVQLATGLQRAGWDVSVVSMREPGEPPATLLESGIDTESLGIRHRLDTVGGAWALRAKVKAWRPDIVHAHMAHASLLARLVRLMAPIPRLVCTLHGLKMYRMDGTGNRGRELAHQLTDSLADLTTAVCQAAADYYVGRGIVEPGRMRVVPNGVDTDRYRPDEARRAAKRRELGLNGEFLWLAAAHLRSVKAFPDLLRAFRMVAAKQPEAQLAIAGDGEQRGELEALAGQLGLAQRVRFLGHRGDVDELMNAADGFVLSSVFEGLALVLLEASASGLPVVATETGGNPEIVAEAQSGFLAQPGAPDRLAEAMLRVGSAPAEVRRAWGESGRCIVLERYRFEAILRQWQEVYEELGRRNGKR